MVVEVGTLLVSLGLEARQYQRGLQDATRRTNSFTSHVQRGSGLARNALGGVAAALGLASFTSAISEGLDYASSLGEVAQQLGVSTKALQEYRYAASQTGISQDQIDQSLSQLTKRLGLAAAGTKAPAEAFAALGVNIRDANGQVRDAGELIPEIAAGLQKLDSPAERAALQVALFGKAGQSLAPLLNEGASGVNALRDAASSLGIVLSSEQIAKADKTADNLTKLQTVLKANIASAVSDNSGSILAFVDAVVSLVSWLGKAAQAWTRFSQEARRADAQLTLLTDFNESDRRAARAAIRTIDYEQGRNAPGTDRARPINLNNLGRPDFVDGGQGAVQLTSGVRRPLRAAPSYLAPDATRPSYQPGAGPRRRNFNDDQGDYVFDSVLALSGRVPASTQAASAAVRTMVADIGGAMRGIDAALAQPAERAATSAEESLRGLQQETRSILDRLFPVAAGKLELEQQIATLTAAQGRAIISTEQLAMAVDALRRNYGTLGEGVTDWRQLIEDNLPALALNVPSDPGDELVATWEAQARRLAEINGFANDNFSDTVDGILSQLSRLSSGIKSGDILDIIGGVFGLLDQVGGAVGGFNLGPFKFGAPAGSRATGGPVLAGKSYIVGERGREMFTPTQSGRIEASGGANAVRKLSVSVEAGPMFLATVRDEAGQVVAQSAPSIAAAGSQGAQVAYQRRANYAIPG